VTLARLTNLKTLQFRANTTDLGALREIGSLRYVSMSGPPPPDGIDLSRLAGMTDLTIQVPRAAVIHASSSDGPRIRRHRF